MTALWTAALVEYGHGLIGRPGLHLHEVCSRVRALRTGLCTGGRWNMGRVGLAHCIGGVGCGALTIQVRWGGVGAPYYTGGVG